MAAADQFGIQPAPTHPAVRAPDGHRRPGGVGGAGQRLDQRVVDAVVPGHLVVASSADRARPGRSRPVRADRRPRPASGSGACSPRSSGSVVLPVESRPVRVQRRNRTSRTGGAFSPATPRTSADPSAVGRTGMPHLVSAAAATASCGRTAVSPDPQAAAVSSGQRTQRARVGDRAVAALFGAQHQAGRVAADRPFPAGAGRRRARRCARPGPPRPARACRTPGRWADDRDRRPADRWPWRRR